MTELINGKEIGLTIQEKIKKEIRFLKNKGVNPCLAVILVGEDPASQVYVKNKKKTWQGHHFWHIGLPRRQNKCRNDCL